MKKFSVFVAGAIVLLSLFAVTAFKPLAPRKSASGQGSLLNPHFNDRVQHFSFHAASDADGSNVTGSWESNSPGQGIRTHGTITCLQILPDGKTAYMTGIITHRDGDGFAGLYEVGDPIWFKVRDNGEGNNSVADQFSDYYNVGGCLPRPTITMYPITGGNIQVRP